ncbi:MAG: hypothetical protein II900_04860 [Prevotella sp.]|nr:hypothetical protein [Prevotella sp.]
MFNTSFYSAWPLILYFLPFFTITILPFSRNFPAFSLSFVSISAIPAVTASSTIVNFFQTSAASYAALQPGST